MELSEESWEIAGRFAFLGEVAECSPYGNGHINGTFRVRCSPAGQEYILQKINGEVFRDPEGLMQNIDRVTGFLRERIREAGGSPERETLTLVRTKEGELCHRAADGSCWRAYLFIPGTVCYERVERLEDFRRCGMAFGRFQRMLAGFPAGELAETIPGFHDTPSRFVALSRAAEMDVCGRAAEVESELAFFQERKEELRLQSAGRLPLRVTHNDTKLNNILFDRETGEGLCVIDLDTVMPGFSVFDFGDAIRFGANTAREDEPDVGKVSLSLPLFEAYTQGFLAGCAGQLTEEEVKALPWGAKLMTLECGMRFLTDYLEGDIYFKTAHPAHNLDRARTHIALVADMERKWAEMGRIVEACAAKG